MPFVYIVGTSIWVSYVSTFLTFNKQTRCISRLKSQFTIIWNLIFNLNCVMLSCRQVGVIVGVFFYYECTFRHHSTYEIFIKIKCAGDIDRVHNKDNEVKWIWSWSWPKPLNLGNYSLSFVWSAAQKCTGKGGIEVG